MAPLQPQCQVEADPQGLLPQQAGAKLDAGKVRLGLVLGDFAQALMAVGRVGTDGAVKYTPHGWLQVADGQARYTDALYRHLLGEAAGDPCDPGTGLLHAAHAAWNALARLELMLRAAGKAIHSPPHPTTPWEATMFQVKPQDEEIDAVLNRCADSEDEGSSEYPGASYEQGVQAAIEWLRDGGLSPFER